MKRLAIDPGDRHVGWARNPDGSMRVITGEWRPDEAVDAIVYLMTRNEVDELILEEFSLYSSHTNEQIGSRLLTSQLIGGLKVIARMFGIPWIEQGAYIKTATRNQLRGRGIKQVGRGVHERDAELHLYNRIIRQKEGR